jgi:hypothetical protein
MRGLVVQPVTFVWIVLMLATCVTWWSAKGGAVPPIEATAIVMVVAAVKARLVILHFMKLKEAPPSWRLLFEGWVVLSTAVILGGYWYALGAAPQSSRAFLPRIDPSRPVEATYQSSTDSSKRIAGDSSTSRGGSALEGDRRLFDLRTSIVTSRGAPALFLF